jgi:hypothetical protein
MHAAMNDCITHSAMMRRSYQHRAGCDNQRTLLSTCSPCPRPFKQTLTKLHMPTICLAHSF